MPQKAYGIVFSVQYGLNSTLVTPLIGIACSGTAWGGMTCAIGEKSIPYSKQKLNTFVWL
jgi:hypothetical protein